MPRLNLHIYGFSKVLPACLQDRSRSNIVGAQHVEDADTNPAGPCIDAEYIRLLILHIHTPHSVRITIFYRALFDCLMDSIYSSQNY